MNIKQTLFLLFFGINVQLFGSTNPVPAAPTIKELRQNFENNNLEPWSLTSGLQKLQIKTTDKIVRVTSTPSKRSFTQDRNISYYLVPEGADSSELTKIAEFAPIESNTVEDVTDLYTEDGQYLCYQAVQFDEETQKLSKTPTPNQKIICCTMLNKEGTPERKDDNQIKKAYFLVSKQFDQNVIERELSYNNMLKNVEKINFTDVTNDFENGVCKNPLHEPRIITYKHEANDLNLSPNNPTYKSKKLTSHDKIVRVRYKDENGDLLFYYKGIVQESYYCAKAGTDLSEKIQHDLKKNCDNNPTAELHDVTAFYSNDFKFQGYKQLYHDYKTENLFAHYDETQIDKKADETIIKVAKYNENGELQKYADDQIVYKYYLVKNGIDLEDTFKSVDGETKHECTDVSSLYNNNGTLVNPKTEAQIKKEEDERNTRAELKRATDQLNWTCGFEIIDTSNAEAFAKTVKMAQTLGSEIVLIQKLDDQGNTVINEDGTPEQYIIKVNDSFAYQKYLKNNYNPTIKRSTINGLFDQEGKPLEGSKNLIIPTKVNSNQIIDVNTKIKPLKNQKTFLQKYKTMIAGGTGITATFITLYLAYKNYKIEASKAHKKPMKFGAFIKHVIQNPKKYPLFFATAGATIIGTAIAYKS